MVWELGTLYLSMPQWVAGHKLVFSSVSKITAVKYVVSELTLSSVTKASITNSSELARAFLCAWMLSLSMVSCWRYHLNVQKSYEPIIGCLLRGTKFFDIYLFEFADKAFGLIRRQVVNHFKHTLFKFLKFVANNHHSAAVCCTRVAATISRSIDSNLPKKSYASAKFNSRQTLLKLSSHCNTSSRLSNYSLTCA